MKKKNISSVHRCKKQKRFRIGKTFELLETKDTESTITGHSSKAMAEPYIDSVLNDSISDFIEEVKQNM